MNFYGVLKGDDAEFMFGYDLLGLSFDKDSKMSVGRLTGNPKDLSDCYVMPTNTVKYSCENFADYVMSISNDEPFQILECTYAEACKMQLEEWGDSTTWWYNTLGATPIEFSLSGIKGSLELVVKNESHG